MAAPRAVIAGLGRTGLSVARHLLARGWTLSGTDTRAQPPELAALLQLAPQMRISTGRLDEALLHDADCVVVSPGVPLQGPFFTTARALGLEIVGDIELFARATRGRVVGITGTNGKSTVTTLVARMAARAGLKVGAGGNLGPPALDLLDVADTELFVLELSSYQLETTESLALAAATVLNVTPDHLDRYASMAEYAGAKARIFARCATAVINLDDPLVAAMPRPGQRSLSFSLRAAIGADYSLQQYDRRWWLARQEQALLAIDELRIGGLHNAANALAALALGEALELPLTAMLAELKVFPGLAHRAEWVTDINGVRYINDSKGTNVGATLAAVAGFDGPLVVIVGGDGKNQDFAPLRLAFAGKVRHAVLIGRDAPQIAAALAGVCSIEHCDTLEDAVRACARSARAGETVLLSPACASLDMFRDYAHRGDVFTAAVRSLAA
ncbi:MAG TPA: UDP-N-acetylmuramoyl-L-alanine--D-glutamate ligase [Steroidobacteraceae bacterium]|nr:UDP-N-acetylmuramoyl-L-alanine--D-glutamate ligase [Steroidobacteraceae bacterium]